MATPLSLRDAVARLTREARRDLFVVWDRVSSARDAEEALRDLLPALVGTYGDAAAVLAAEWYDEIRTEAAPRGRFDADPVNVPDSGEQALVGWALSTATDYGSFQSLVEGGMHRRIANHSRLTVARSSVADSQAAGWKRIGVGACAFCRMLIQRDVLYSEATADFAAHDDCNCQAYPLIKGAEPVDVKKYVKSSRYTEDDAARAKENARVREWMADNL